MVVSKRFLGVAAAIYLLLALNALAFTSTLPRLVEQRPSPTALDYTTPEHEPTLSSSVSAKPLTVSVRKKPIVSHIRSLEELKTFLEEDERLTVVK